ncbi:MULTISPECIES: UTRA domain-containing protein [Enterobacter]|jgi:DNA-binding GntR family transcriptional regulator|uniref:UTRA domain-containing protein n=1 Tax=Enterobacter pseudoroggenkampii TaxID=2996112 RepID=A0ABT3XJ49_9ENTR|nr:MULTISPECIES: UTRA domain-containing protein [Enterobacter]MCK6907417.1 GntR family transcriptional regulator [Enterobacter roggenkampii]QGW89263.1 UTRA domain-containing protein [Enterobacter asburiae]KAE8273148.1 UTRA domain-containing protein [Enterobacter sp. C6]MCX8305819.1 UTRA domain-containing protein [Enterobacter pseudoroggenkampii]WJW85986.1 UTRA domain-containing protein [Enterobacter pseudoroggenkampii]
MKEKNYVDVLRERFERWLSEQNLPAGSKLPSERELCELLDAKRMTLRQVLIELEVGARIFRKNRSGWFISAKRFIYNPKSLSSFNAEARAQGRNPSWGYLSRESMESVPHQVERVFPASENCYRVTGWCGLDEHKVFYHESYIDAETAPGYIHKLENQSFASVWEDEFGHTLTIKEMIFKPVNMPELACKELGVAPNTYGILVEKHRATRDKKVVQVDFEYWRLESVELVIHDE